MTIRTRRYSISKLNYNCVDCALKKMSKAEGDPRLTSSMKEQLQFLQMDLRFLKMYICCLDQWNLHTGSTKKSHLNLKKADKCLYTACIAALGSGEFENLDILVTKLREIIQHYKPKIKTICLDLLDRTFKCKFSISELQKFMGCIVISLNNLICMKADMLVDLKMQIDALKLKVTLFPQLIDFNINRSRVHKPLKTLSSHVQAWAHKAACLSLLYWTADDNEENIAAKMDIVLSDLLRKIMPRAPEAIGMYIGVLMASTASSSEIERTGEVVVNTVDFLLEDLVVSLKDGPQKLREGLIILIIFCMEKCRDGKNPDKLKSLLRQAAAVVEEAASLICSLCVDESNESDLGERSSFLLDFIERIDVVKGNITNLYSPTLDSASMNYPTTGLLGYIDLLSEILKSKLIPIPSIKHQLVILREELLSLRPFLKDIQQLQYEQDEVNELRTRIANMAYQAGYAVNSFGYMHDCLWNLMICLSNVTEEIKLIKSEVLKTRNQETFNIREVDIEMRSNLGLPVQANPSRIDEIVGFEEDAETIIDRLTKGPTELDIVSIVGMPGLGKTTLAEKVYNDPSVKYHFHKRAWSCVSQSYKYRKLLLEILSAVIMLDDDIGTMTGEQLSKQFRKSFKGEITEVDLAERLYKSLKGQRYLIVLDDIWDIKAWNELKQSFPDDGNGSRIIFTSRIYDISLQAKSNCIPHLLNPLSDEESWMLLQQKLFNKDGCPRLFSRVGMQVAKRCKGLPLSIVLIAGLLARRVKSLWWWKQIAGTLGSLVTREMSMGITELSYKHLPEFLKPCFLYLGLFLEDHEIKVQKLIKLWISEELVQYSGMRNLENVAEGYLMDLVTRSLVTISRRSSTGGIKTCRIHDLLREFCLVKGQKENFFRVMCLDGDSGYPRCSVYKHYRLCIQTKWKSFLKSKPVGPRVHSLMVYPNGNHFYDWNYFNFRNFEYLQVLDMEDFRFTSYNHFVAITSLVLLRYLALCCSFSQVPPSIVHLVNLETIYVGADESLDELPKNFWTAMKKLRHVDMTPWFRDVSISSQLHEPEESSQLKDLQTLSTLYICAGDNAEALFRRMPRVRKLKFIVGRGVQFPALHFVSELESLSVKYDRKLNMPYPGAINFPSTLKKLTLSSFYLTWSAISSIGDLPNLEVLKLLYRSFEGERWAVEAGMFLKLKFLKLEKLNLAEWSCSEDAFPCLEQLVVNECLSLKEIPSSFGNIPTLKTLKIAWCTNGISNSISQILEEQRDMGNEDLQIEELTDEYQTCSLPSRTRYDCMG